MNNENRQNIIDQATFLFRKKGYTATSISEIVEACNVTKGALYYHFPNKEQLALEAIKQVKDFFIKEIFIIAKPKKSEAINSLKTFNEKIELFFLKNEDGCLLANLSLELGASYELFRNEILDFFALWEKSYYWIFLNFFPEDEAKNIASNSLASAHGCILIYRASGNLSSLKRLNLNLIASCVE